MKINVTSEPMVLAPTASRAGVILGGLAILVVLALAVFIFLPKSNPKLPPAIGSLSSDGVTKLNAECDSLVKVNDTKAGVSCYIYIGCNSSGSISCIENIFAPDLEHETGTKVIPKWD